MGEDRQYIYGIHKHMSGMTLDYYETLAEELKLNGFDVKVLSQENGSILLMMDTIAGVYSYSAAYKNENNIMADFYRFISNYGLKLHTWGLSEKIKTQ